MERKRYALLDTIRGSVLISMIVYHACWNFVYIYGMNWSWYKSFGAYIWQQSICRTFILLSGFCFLLGKRHWKSGLSVFGGGLLITVVTVLVMPENRVVFGVLTCIGSCILIVNLMEKLLKKVSPFAGIIVSGFLFLFTENISQGFLGLGNMEIINLPESWYDNWMTTFLGLPFRGFYSTDYFSLIPWIFLFLTGFYLHLIFLKMGWMEKGYMKKTIAPLAFLGRHSLGIYLIHQPLIYGLQELLL